MSVTGSAGQGSSLLMQAKVLHFFENINALWGTEQWKSPISFRNATFKKILSDITKFCILLKNLHEARSLLPKR